MTDGTRLYVGGTGVLMYEPDTDVAVELKPGLDKVTCLKIRQRESWVGTADSGIPSFPRRRESTLRADWIPACAGMT